ncbi:MAG: ATP synthase subunit I [Nitrosomonadales bacterium]|nr:ATP synthase subunit I [Nitrosomonadales bacterium]
MNNVAKITISRDFIKAARWQIIITVLISGVSLMVAGMDAAVSAIVGGTTVIVGGFAGMMMARRPNGGTPGTILFSLLKAEVFRLLVIAVLLLMIFKYFRGLVPLPLIGGLAGSVLAAGAGLRTVNNKNDE